MKRSELRVLPLPAAILCALAFEASAATIDVDHATCSLADAVRAANTDLPAGGCTAGEGVDTVRLTVEFDNVLPPIPIVTSDIDFVGTFDASTRLANEGGPLFVIGAEGNGGEVAPTVSFSHLDMHGSRTGGAGAGGGGGGAGMGACLFVYAGSVTLDSMSIGCQVLGGSGASAANPERNGGGGGGGFAAVGGASGVDGQGGNGGSVAEGFLGGGGGGGGDFAVFGFGGGTGGHVGLLGGGSGGIAGGLAPGGGAFGAGGGGGAAGLAAGQSGQAGATGGFGGGGGGGGYGTSVLGGAGGPGGFGGGGGAGGGSTTTGGPGGAGGFGAGGGTGGNGETGGAGGAAGFGAGQAKAGVPTGGAHGASGAGLGGAIFVRSGTLRISQSAFAGNSAVGGPLVGGDATTAGSARGGALFVIDAAAVAASASNTNGLPPTLPTVEGCGNSFSSSIAAGAGSSDTNNVDVYGTSRTALLEPCVVVSGNGLAIANGDATPDASDGTHLGTVVAAGPTANVSTFSLENHAFGTLSVNEAGMVVGSTAFTLTPAPPLTIAADSSATFGVRFDPITVGPQFNSVQLSLSDAGVGFYEFAVAGIGANSAPIIDQGDAITVPMSTPPGGTRPFALPLTASDGDLDALQWSISAPADVGNAGVDANGVVSYTPPDGFEGDAHFSVQVGDGQGGTDAIAVTVQVHPDRIFANGFENL